MSNSLWPYGLQHARPLNPSLSPRVCSDLCPLSWWYHPTISSPAALFSFCLKSLRASGSFPLSHLIASGGPSIGASASASVLPVNIQCWFPLGLTGLISLQSKGLSRVFSSTTVQKHQFFWHSAVFMVQLRHSYMTTGKTSFHYVDFCLLCNTLSRFIIAFLPRSKHLLISCCSHLVFSLFFKLKSSLGGLNSSLWLTNSWLWEVILVSVMGRFCGWVKDGRACPQHKDTTRTRREARQEGLALCEPRCSRSVFRV